MPLVQVNQLQYSDKYNDDEFEYRHIILPKDVSKHIPRTHLMTESEWRNLGIAQSPGWVHYMLHGPGTVPSLLQNVVTLGILHTF